MGQEKSTNRLTPHVVSQKQLQSFQPSFEHESFLKLRKTPFKNSVRISDSPVLFLENTQTTLAHLLSDRLGTTRLFTQQDIIKLVETSLYGLAYLENNGIVYKDLTTDNIFYDTEEGVFKLLPTQLIEQTSYNLVVSGKQFRNLPPQLILALRMEEDELEEDILQHANTFMLGMILLQMCTLKSSSECYDDDNFDILDKAIQERLTMVRECYPLKIAELLTMMLEYDYTKRATIEQLSLLVNEEIIVEKNKKKDVLELNKYTPKMKQIDKVPRFYRPSAVQQQQTSSPYEKPLQNITRFNAQSSQVKPFQNQPRYTKQYPAQYYQHSPQQDKRRRRQPQPFKPSLQMRSSDLLAKQNREETTQMSLYRIKQEIERSRKRIQQFNRQDVGRFGS